MSAWGCPSCGYVYDEGLAYPYGEGSDGSCARLAGSGPYERRVAPEN